LIPIYEELMFRLPLKISAPYVNMSLSLFISSAFLIILNTIYKDEVSLVNYYLGTLGLAVPIFFIFKMFKGKRVKEVLLKNYNLFFYGSILLFAALHFYYVPISLSAILTYLIYGYSLSFLRISTNFLCAVVMHLLFIAPYFISILHPLL
jgi:hypothetical protein